MAAQIARPATLLATVSLLAFGLAGAGQAQEASQAGPAASQEAQAEDTTRGSDEIIVTGTRRNDLTAAESPTPIDIISSAELLTQGSSDVNDILRQQVPSINVQRFTSNDGSVFTRPYSLRGLPPDQTLVLVNGKRRHRGATVQLSNIPYIRGSQGPDLATIPSIAIGQLEVLRDGASANYGSDAIAGVLNFRLRTDNEGATVIGRYGQFYEGDGEDMLLQGNVGLPFTSSGFVNISGEYASSDITSRQDQRPDAQALINRGVQGVPVPAQRTGNPESEAARLFVNAGLDLSDTMEFYTFGNYSWSEGTTAFFYRNPETNPLFASVPLTQTAGGPRFTFRTQFPGGFSPDFHATIRDASLIGGLRGNLSDLTYDVSSSYGRNDVSYRHQRTAFELISWFQAQPEVRRVLYPALPSDPGHEIWKRDFDGASGLFGVLLDPISPSESSTFFNGLQLFKMGASWGGFESLMVPAWPAPVRSCSTVEEGSLVRVHAGLEATADLIDDLEAAFARLRATRTTSMRP